MEQNIKKTISEYAEYMLKDIAHDGLSEAELLAKWTSKMLSLNNEFRKEKKKLSFQEVYQETISAVTTKDENKYLFKSVSTGLTELDKLLGGLPLGELIIVGARPAMGKTALLLSIVANSIRAKNEPIAFISLEISSQGLMLRLFSQMAELGTQKMRKQILKEDEILQLKEKSSILETSNVIIEDNCFSIEDIIIQTDYLVKEKGVKLIIIDYLQMIRVGGRQSREQEIAKICRELKALAVKYNVAILVSSQLSRAVETRGGDKKPQLSDLRESGSIEQDADKVLFLHRPEYYNITEDENGMDTRGVAEIIVAKNRTGPVDSCKVKFVGEFGYFKNLEPLMFDNIFKHIRSNEFDGKTPPPTRGSRMNDIDEDHPF